MSLTTALKGDRGEAAVVWDHVGEPSRYIRLPWSPRRSYPVPDAGVASGSPAWIIPTIKGSVKKIASRTLRWLVEPCRSFFLK